MPLADPLCGSSTLPIEAACAALGREAGLALCRAFWRFALRHYTSASS